MAEQNVGTKKSRRVYSTESINQLLEDRKQGYEIDYSPFFEKDLDLRAAGVVFRMTDEEYSEYLRCYKDPIYFIENYCKFRTDKGYTLVKLRDFQKDIIRIATEETYDEEQDLFIPKNRNIIWMAARQSSKTTTLCAILAYKMIFSEFNCICFANKEDTSKELIDKTNNIFKTATDVFNKTLWQFLYSIRTRFIKWIKVINVIIYHNIRKLIKGYIARCRMNFLTHLRSFNCAN